MRTSAGTPGRAAAATSRSRRPAGSCGPCTSTAHDEGCSITGGFVYRGALAPSLRGRYVYADFCESWIRAVRPTVAGTTKATTHKGVGGITSFGEDGNGELYVASANTNRVYRVVG